MGWLKMSNATVRESRTQSTKLFPGLGNMEVVWDSVLEQEDTGGPLLDQTLPLISE